jgi:hypothetical protein
MMWLPALFALFMRFSLGAHWMAIVACLGITVALYLWRRPSLTPQLPPGMPIMLACVVPMTVLGIYLLSRNVLRPVDGALHTSQSGFGDMSIHLGIITSLARQGTFPPEYSILPGIKMGYPFLCDSISASLYLLGAPLRLAYALPMAVAMFLCFLGYYLLILQWFYSRRKAALAFWLFFLGGGFGFAYFFDQSDLHVHLSELFTSFYQTPTNWTEMNLRWVNPVADMMLPQRATLFGWTLLLPCLYLLYRLTFEKGRSSVVLGIIAGGLVMVSTHAFMALGVISIYMLAYTLIKERQLGIALKRFAPYALIALALALPQLFTWTFSQATRGNFLRPHLNWVNENDNILWFYLKNIGVVFLFLLPAVLGAKGHRRAFWLCAAPLWLLAELVQFQPNEYDNNKLMFITHMLSCGIVASWLVGVYRRLRGLGGRRVIAAVVVAAGTLSGVMTLMRECVSDYELFSADLVAAARFIDQTLPPDAMLLTSTQHNNAPASLAGRNIVSGSPTYLFFHGVMDYARDANRALMLTGQQQLAELGPHYGVTHVYVSSYERAEGARDELFADYPLLYEDGGVSIYLFPGGS